VNLQLIPEQGEDLAPGADRLGRAVALLLTGTGATPAAAACYTGPFPYGNTNSKISSCIQVANTSFSGAVTNNGVITPGGIDVTNSTVSGYIINNNVIDSGGISVANSTIIGGVADNGTTLAGGITVDSRSLITGSGTITAIAVSLSTFSGGISNAGVITSNGSGISVGAVLTFAGGITNSGSIAAGFNDIVIFGATAFSGGIVNSGRISSPSSFGILAALVSTFSGGITNSRTITAGAGVRVGYAGFPVAAFSGGVSNSGVITAAKSGIGVVNVSAFSGGITNSGSITGGTGIVLGAGISTFSGAIVNSGSITGSGGVAINVAAANNPVTIDQTGGVISGAIDLSVNADLLNISGGAINGNILGLGTSDTVNFALGSGVFTYSDTISGVNNINFNSGTTVLNGAIDNGGGAAVLTIAPGAALLIGSAAAVIEPSVTDNGVFGFAQSGAYAFSGVISGTGAVEQIGPGSTTLTGANIYSGGTTISAGTLQLGNGGATGSITGNVVDNATLAFDRSDTVTFGGVISGAGAVSQIGAGATVLTGANSYSGGTTISAGTLQLGNGGATGSITGNVVDNATLAFDRSDTVTFGGVISGVGAVSQIGAGAVTLTADNAYSGGTSLDAGTLIVGNDSALGTGALSMAAGTTLSFLSSGNFRVANAIRISGDPSFTPPSGTVETISGVISNGATPGTLEMSGAGTLVLSATNAYTGPTKVNSGTLDVTGSIASSNLTTVSAGATLTGDGAVAVTQVGSGGVFAPGAPGAPGTSTKVFGNLVFSPGAAYYVAISPTAASFASVSGATSLAGSVVAEFSPGTYLTRKYTILTTTGGLGGATFSGLATVDPPTGFADGLTYDPDNVYLDLTATLAEATGLNQNQRNVADALDNAFNNGASLPPGFASVLGSTESNLGNALTQLSGEAATGARQSDFLFGDMFLSLLLDPYIENRGGGLAQAGSFGAGSGCIGEGEPQPSFATGLPTKKPSQAAPSLPCAPHWTLWGVGFGGGEQTSGNATIGSHDTSIGAGGFAAGADYHVSPDAMLGFAVTGGWTSWSLSDGLGGGNNTIFEAGLYGAAEFGPAYVAAAASGGVASETTNRTVALPGGGAYNASFNAPQFGGRIEAGYHVPLAPATLTPYFALQELAFEAPSYAESSVAGGPGFALKYASQSASDTRFEFGAWADKTFFMPNGDAMKLFGRLAWAHDWQSNPALTATFQSLPTASFVVNGARSAPNQALITVGAEWRLAKNWTLTAKFEGEFGAGSQTYAATGRISCVW
jgi:fibronectin-binding autotransporter adhesin